MDDMLTVFHTGVALTTGAASVNANVPNTSSGNVPRFVRIAATAAATVRIGSGTQTAVATDLLVQPGDAVILVCPHANPNVAALQVTTSGKVIVTPLDNA